ncbi:MAG: L-alanine-DL-glutamate epimerase, partial [Flavitalea sp.]
MNRRTFVKHAMVLGPATQLSYGAAMAMKDKLKSIRVIHTGSNFEREKLIRPFGFKGGYLTELWQTAAQLKTTENTSTGIATQSVLYGDADLFKYYSEAGGNALMYALTEKALHLVKQTSFTTPPELLDAIEPEL